MRSSTTFSEELRSSEVMEPSTHTEETGAFSLNLTEFVWRRRRIVARWMFCGLVFATIIAFLLPKKYQSITSLMPPENKPEFNALQLATQGAGGLGALAGSMLDIKTPGAVFVGVLQSHAMQERLVNRFDLRRVYRTRYMQDARSELAKHTTVSLDRKSGIVTITVEDGDPQRAANLAGAYVEELNSLMATLNTSGARREREFLEGRLKSVKSELDSAARDFSQFASKNTAIDIKEQGKAMLESAAILQGQLTAAETELEGLKQAYSDTNIRVRQQEARITELQKQLSKLGGVQGGGLEENKATDYPSIRQLPLLGVTYSDLFRRTKIEETVYELLTQQYEMAKVQEAKSIASVRVLDPAEVPERKSSPSRMAIMAAGTLFAGILCIAFLYGSDRWSRVNPHDPRKVLANEILGGLKFGSGKGSKAAHLPGLQRWFTDSAAHNTQNGNADTGVATPFEEHAEEQSSKRIG